MKYLKQSTAVTIKLGPFLDEDDGKSTEAALTISQADIRLSKNGAAFAQTNNATGATHDESGWYGIPLDATDTNTLGILQVAVHEAGALPCWDDFMVLPANVYDSIVSGSDVLDVNVSQLSTSSTAADNLEASSLAIVSASATATTLSTTQMSTTLTEATDAHFAGCVVIWTSGALAGQRSAVTAYDGTAKTLTFNTTTEAPGNGDTFVLV
jgi:hypothetical protein